MTSLGSEFHATHLKLPRTLSYEDFEQECRTVGRMARANRWWACDLIAFGERRYGERAYQALDHLGDERERMLLARMADTFPPERRRSVSFEHHRVLLPLEPHLREQWLADAEQEGWTRARLRKALHLAGLITPRKRPTPTEDSLWARVRRALDLLTATREKMNDEPWPEAQVARLIEDLEATFRGDN